MSKPFEVFFSYAQEDEDWLVSCLVYNGSTILLNTSIVVRRGREKWRYL
jgi:hypothetical protein